jgi:hypothetical protein
MRTSCALLPRHSREDPASRSDTFSLLQNRPTVFLEGRPVVQCIAGTVVFANGLFEFGKAESLRNAWSEMKMNEFCRSLVSVTYRSIATEIGVNARTRSSSPCAAILNSSTSTWGTIGEVGAHAAPGYRGAWSCLTPASVSRRCSCARCRPRRPGQDSASTESATFIIGWRWRGRQEQVPGLSGISPPIWDRRSRPE